MTLKLASGSAHAPAPAERCAQHPEGRPAGVCIRCRRPICTLCVEARGYFCSDACRDEQSRTREAESGEGAPRLSRDEAARAERVGDLVARWAFRRIPLAALAVAAAVLGLNWLDGSGTELWRVVAPTDVRYLDLAAEGERVYALRSDGFCTALNAATGAEVWKTRLREERPPEPGEEAPERPRPLFFDPHLAVTGGLVVCRDMESLDILDAADGTRRWRRDTGGFGQPEPAVGGSRVIMSDWQSAPQATPRAGGHGFRSFLSMTGGESARGHGRIVCADLASGRDVWTRSFTGRQVRAVGLAGDLCYGVSTALPRFRWIPCERHAGTESPSMARCRECRSEWIGGADFALHAMRADTGVPLWTGRLKDESIERVEAVGDRLLVLTSGRLYLLGGDGSKAARERLSDGFWRASVEAGHLVLGTRGNRLEVRSSVDGGKRWETVVNGQVWDIRACEGLLYVTAGVPRADSDRTPDGAPDMPAAPTPQEQFLKEMGGPYGVTTPPLGPPIRTLIAYRLADGRERWRTEGFVGQLTVIDRGHLELLQGAQTAALFMIGTGAVIDAYESRRGRRCWRYKIPEAVHALRAGGGRVFIVTEPGRGALGEWNAKAERGSKVRAIRGRTFLNHVRPF